MPQALLLQSIQDRVNRVRLLEWDAGLLVDSYQLSQKLQARAVRRAQFRVCGHEPLNLRKKSAVLLIYLDDAWNQRLPQMI